MDRRLRWLNNLLCFEVAARHESYSKAADELCITQAAVSQQMRQLEQNLQVKLFRRSARRMLLTSQGQILFEACQNGFSEVINGLNKVQEEPLEGSLTVSTTQAFCALWLLPNLFKFFNQYPDININTFASNRIESLHDGKIDIAIRFSTSTSSIMEDGLEVQKFGENGIVPVCSPDYKQTLALNTPFDLLDARLLALAFGDRANWESYFEHCNIDITNRSLKKTEISSSDLALSAALTGQGVMLASDVMIGQYVKSGQLVVPFNIPHPVRWKSHFVYLKNSPRKKRIALFCRWLAQQMEDDEALMNLDQPSLG